MKKDSIHPINVGPVSQTVDHIPHGYYICFLSVREPVDTAHPEFDLDDATREYEPETLLGSIRRYLQDHAYSENIQTSGIVQTFQASDPD